MKRILIANRGEIACRIIRSCKKLGLQSIAVYSDIDKNSKHVKEAGESIHIGGSKAQESYLLAEKIIEVAKKLNADAIHPGYGFMAENAEFAQNVIDSGIIWIGPKPSTIISMGNKDVARDLAIKNNLPICPGLKDEDLKKDDLEKKCNEIGYPILIKASAGGGGIGMRIANNYEELIQSIEKTKNLAKKAFGNSDIFLEKFISNARHIEIQVFGLGERKALHFYERDCSIQRRFQKIIEESPAPEIKDSIINEMAESAVNFVTNQNYEGAGTIEFIYDIDNKKFYFLEMNTRIQVEHPVTEMITNSDLVSMQIQFALNLDLKSIEQNKINKSGHAIECRLYAEDPAKNFLPSPGKITKLNLPNTGFADIRLDIGVDEGDEISFYYDPMIAKIISKSENRIESINNMIHYLSELEIEGINTNKSFLISVLKNESFEKATYNTKFIENNLSLFTKESETLKKDISKTINEENIVQKYTDKDVEAFKKITAQSPNKKHSDHYTENDFKAFKNILNKKNDNQKKGSIKNIIGKVYEEPVFKPGGDKYMVIEFGNLMDLEINFTAQNLAKAVLDNKIKGIYETAPCFASMLIHYNPDEIKFNELKNEMK